MIKIDTNIDLVIAECLEHRKEMQSVRYNYTIKAKHGNFQVSGIGRIRVLYVNPTNGHCIFHISDENTKKNYDASPVFFDIEIDEVKEN